MTTNERSPASLATAFLLAALTLPFDPHWVDFEAARRALAMGLVGALLLLRPAWFAARSPGDGLLLLGIGWSAVSTLLHANAVVPTHAVLRLGWWAAIWALVRLGNGTGVGAAVRIAPLLLGTAALVGLAQRFSLPWASGSALEPVGLFGNRNVAAEFTAVAGAVVVAHFDARPRVSTAALLLAGAYAIANGSRSALVALPLVALLAVALSPGRRLAALRPFAALVVGAGLALGALTALPTGSDPGAPWLPGSNTGTATLEVRFEIQKGALSMLGEAPLTGHGAGQFAVQYPRHRSQREIELSSLQRQEPRRVATAHQDWLEVAVDGGIPALCLLVLFAAVRLLRDAPRRTTLPLVALFLLMLVRAPLGNAPALALAVLGSAPRAPAVLPPTSLRRAWILRIVGLWLVLLGALASFSHFALARYVAARGDAPTGDVVWLERATALPPLDATALELLARERQIAARSAADVERALGAVDAALRLFPHETSYQLLRADLLRSAARFPEAKQQLANVAALDPGHPQVQVQLAAVYFTEGDADGAVVALCTDPPPAARERLAGQLDEFARLAREGGLEPAAARFAAEAAFVRVLDALHESGPLADALAKERFDRMREAFATASLHDRDVRELLLLAVLAIRVGDTATAASAGDLAQKKGLPLLAWHWSLARPFAEGLRAYGAWKDLLPPR